MAFGIPMLAGLFGNGQQPPAPQTGTLNLGGQQKQVTLPQGQIQAPQDRGFFGRFNGFNPMRFEDTGVNPIYALGAALAGGAADNPMVTAQLIGQKQEIFRKQKKEEEDRARKEAVVRQMGLTGGDAALFAMDPSAALAERRDSRNFDYQRGRDQTMDARDERNFNRGVMESDRSFGLQENQFNEGVRQFGMTYDQGERRLNQDQSQFDATMGLSRDRFNEDVRQFGLTYALQKDEADRKAEEAKASNNGMYRPATPEEVAQFGYDPSKVKGQMSPKGQFTVVNEGESPPKPLIGSEAMARVAANLPNMKDAVANLDALMGNRGTDAPKSEKGRYAPGHDWGAQLVDAVPDWGLLQPVAKAMGGKDYQQFNNAYDTFAGAILPILSGSAVTPQERENIMSAIEVLNGDDGTTAQRKLMNMKSMVAGIEAAAAGDMDLFDQYMAELNAYGASLRTSANPPADPEGEALVNKWLNGGQ